MTFSAQVLSVLLLVVLATTAGFDLVRSERAFAVTDRLGIPRDAVPVLGGVKVAAAVAVFVGTDMVRVAEAAGLFLVLYFAVAVLTHLRARDGVRNTVPAAAMLVVSAAYVLATVAR
jgi:hypothetical protein